MSVNDQVSIHLLNWLNGQMQVQGKLQTIKNMDDIKQSGAISILLSKVNGKSFSDGNDQPFNHYLILTAIQRYLLETQDLRLKKNYRQLVIDSQSVIDIVRLVLFLIMKLEEKQQFVTRILEQDQQTQMYLMNQLKQVQSNMQSNIEIKQIFAKIEELEEYNQTLKDKICEQEKIKDKNMMIKVQLIHLNEKLLDENKKITKQKSQVAQELDISAVESYAYLYKELERQRSDLVYSQNEIDVQGEKLVEENKELLAKIEEDKQVFENLYEQKNKYTNAIKELKGEGQQVIKSFKSRENKENFIEGTFLAVPNIKMIKSISDDTTFTHSRNYSEYDEDEPVKNSIRSHSDHLQSKLTAMHAKIAQLNQEVISLKDSTHKLSRGNRKKEKMIYLAERAMNDFRASYEYTISG